MESRKYSEETLTANVKKKNILLVIEYCLENKIEFVVSPGSHNDDFMIGFVIKDLSTAIALGISLKDLKIELNGLPSFVSVNTIKTGKKSATSSLKEEEAHSELADSTLKFDLESIH